MLTTIAVARTTQAAVQDSQVSRLITYRWSVKLVVTSLPVVCNDVRLIRNDARHERKREASCQRPWSQGQGRHGTSQEENPEALRRDLGSVPQSLVWMLPIRGALTFAVASRWLTKDSPIKGRTHSPWLFQDARRYC